MIEGQTYIGRQGEGLATTFGRSQALDELAKKQAAKAAERSKALADMSKAKPEEVWHYYSADANKAWESWLTRGAEMMTKKSIDNPWKSTDADAIQWQIEGARLKAGTDNINQAQDLWNEAMKDIGTRGDKYEDGYIEAVKNFPLQNKFDQIVKGGFQFPEARFKNPSDIYQKFFVKDAEELRKQIGDGVMPTPQQLKERVDLFFSSPDNETEMKAARQMYESLPEAAKAPVIAEAERMGWDDEPWKGLAFDNYRSRFATQPRNLIEDVMEYAKTAPKDYKKWSKEDTSGVTKYGSTEKLRSAKYPKDAAESHFNRYSYLLDDEGYMNQLGVDMNVPRSERKEAAVSALAKKIKDNISEKVESGLSRVGGAIGTEEIKVNYDKWREDLGSSDPVLADHAANWLFGVKGEGGVGDVVSAMVKDPSQIMLPLEIHDKLKGITKAVIVEYRDAKAAETAKTKFFKELRYEEVDKDAIKYFEERSEGNTVFYPITNAAEQIIKELHDRTARKKKALYEREMKPGDLDELGTTPPVSSGQGPVNAGGFLDDY